MIPLKTEKEIKIMREGGRRLRQVLNKVLTEIKPGVKEIQLDQLAEQEIVRLGGFPSFKMVPGYRWASCLTVNDQVVHGIPGEERLKEEEVVGVDIGMYFEGFHTDVATTVMVKASKGEKNKKQEETARFLLAGKKALEAAIEKVREGNYIGDLSLAIQKELKFFNYSPVRVLTGHGVGKKLHEPPSIPCFLETSPQNTPQLSSGMTLAIEVIYNQGSAEVFLEDDGWTIVTKDGKMSGLFEETVAVTADGHLILTRQ